MNSHVFMWPVECKTDFAETGICAPAAVELKRLTDRVKTIAVENTRLQRPMQVSLRELLSGQVEFLSPEKNSVHVWRLSTTIAPEDLRQLESFLSPDETARAARFYFERDRRRFVACRGCLRLLLATYSGCPAERICFRYGPQGKPALLNSAVPEGSLRNEAKGGAELRFNVSHSGELALLAFSMTSEIGVDVERIRAELEFLALARSAFSPIEQQAIARLAPENRAPLFYEYWSCKESCIKADGRGVSVGLDQFSVIEGMGPGPQWRRLAVAAPGAISEEMRVRILDVGPGYAAAVAAPLAGWEATRIDIL